MRDVLGLIPRMKRLSTTVLIIATASIAASCGPKGEVIQRYSLIADGQRTVFAQTLEKYRVEYDSLSMGVFVKSINEVASTKTAYWLYFINSQPVPKAADAFTPEVGDTIEWRLISGY